MKTNSSTPSVLPTTASAPVSVSGCALGLDLGDRRYYLGALMPPVE